MKHIVETTREMYYSTEPFAEIIVDKVVWALRKSSVIESQEIALMLDVDQRHLSHALRLLTGMPLHQIVSEWRILQAHDLMADGKMTLEQIARRCGWKNERVLKKVVKNQDPLSSP